MPSTPHFPLPPKCHPVEVSKMNAERIRVSNVEKYKKLDCLFYEKCLTYAAGKQWANFSCRVCHNYTPTDMTPKDIRRWRKMSTLLGQ